MGDDAHLLATGLQRSGGNPPFSRLTPHALIDHMPGMAGLLAPDGSVLHLNRELCEYFGQTHEELADWASKPAELAESPMGRCHRLIAIGKQESEPLRILYGGFDPYRSRFDCACSCGLGAGAHRSITVVQGKIAIIFGAREPFRRNAADTLAARNITL